MNSQPVNPAEIARQPKYYEAFVLPVEHEQPPAAEPDYLFWAGVIAAFMFYRLIKTITARMK